MKPHFLNCRDIDRRILVESLLELTSPCHLGGADANATSDKPLLRDGNGRPYLPGTTLTGLLRAELEQFHPSAAALLFGAKWSDPDGKQARLWIGNAMIVQTGLVATELRDGVKIEASLGIAGDKKKFDLELLPKGTRFRLRFELDLFGRDEDDSNLLRGFIGILQALEQGRIALGAKTRRGFGAARIVADADGNICRVEEYAVKDRNDMYAWLGRGLDLLPEDWPRVDRKTYQNVASLAKEWRIALPKNHARTEFTVTLSLAIQGSILVGSEGHDPDEADRSHLLRLCRTDKGTNTEAIIPATSLAGVLRHRCLRIAKTLAGRENPNASKLVDELFGPEITRRNQSVTASRVWIAEARVVNGCALRHTRVRIDPWTGGAVDSLLFTEDPWYGGQIEFQIKIREYSNPQVTSASRALLLLALRDLANGDLNVGAESSVGRGRLGPIPGCAFAKVVNPQTCLYLEADGSVRCDPPDTFEADFRTLQDILGRGETP